jgi:pimeloyl-ACP methyl ester carboxylesterase
MARWIAARGVAAAGALAAALGACNVCQPENLAIGTTRQEALAEIGRMRQTPVVLARPIVVVDGWRGPGFVADGLADQVRRATSGREQDVLAFSYFWGSNFDQVTGRLVAAVDEKWPSPSADETVEVDVVGFSAGGLVARWAALPAAERARAGQPPGTPTGKRLRVARLYTLATPHAGADMADRMSTDSMTDDMDPASAFLQALNGRAGGEGYELVCYAQTGDLWVGARHAAPPGSTPIWTHGAWNGGHMSIRRNAIFVADICRRLRGEAALARVAGPPPGD